MRVDAGHTGVLVIGSPGHGLGGGVLASVDTGYAWAWVLTDPGSVWPHLPDGDRSVIPTLVALVAMCFDFTSASVCLTRQGPLTACVTGHGTRVATVRCGRKPGSGGGWGPRGTRLSEEGN